MLVLLSKCGVKAEAIQRRQETFRGVRKRVTQSKEDRRQSDTLETPRNYENVGHASFCRFSSIFLCLYSCCQKPRRSGAIRSVEHANILPLPHPLNTPPSPAMRSSRLSATCGFSLPGLFPKLYTCTNTYM